MHVVSGDEYCKWTMNRSFVTARSEATRQSMQAEVLFLDRVTLPADSLGRGMPVADFLSSRTA